MKTKLTIAKIETAKVPSGQTETKLWDSLVNGLYLRISASGGRRWYFRYRNDHGKVRPLKVGDYPALSIDAARDAAKVHAAAVAKGRDPAQARQEKRRSEKATLGSLLAVEGPYERNLNDRGIVNRREVLSCLRRGLSLYMKHDIAKLSRLDFIDAFNRLKELPGARAELRKNSRAFLEWTTNQALTPANVLAGYRQPPKSRAQRLEEAAKRRALDDQDIAKVWRAAEGSGRFGALMRLGLLAGMRRGELAGLRWSDIHADRIVLGAGQTKTGAIHEIPLTPLMREVLASQVRTTSPLVFPSNATGRAMTGWVKLQAKLVREANIGPWTIHDTRRTCRTLMSRCGVPEPAAELAIGHVRATLVALYNLDQQWAARVDAFTRVSDHVGALTRFGMNSNARPSHGKSSRENEIA